MKISEILDDIRKQDLVLPEFQREYVWSREQAKQLMVSLKKDYPVGGLLFWKTDEPPELKNIDELPDKLGMIQVILDGQQRLTTLYLLVNGEIPPYYTDKDIQYDPRELYYNIENGHFEYYHATRMRGNPLWVRVVDCFTNRDLNEYEIAEKLTQEGEPSFKLAKAYGNNLTNLRQIKEMAIPIQTVPVHATIDEAIDIFDRVNSKGTKLSEAELALTHVTGKWSQARREMKKKINELDKLYFSFDLTFMTRSLTGIVTKRALYEAIHDQPKDILISGWKNLSKILDYLVALLPNQAFINSTQDINTTNILVPMAVYLSLNENRFPNENSIKHAVHWLYAAQIWARYSGQVDQRLEYDISLVERETNPWDGLCNQIIDQRGRLEIKSSDFEGRWIQHPLYRMTYILTKAEGAVDWFNGVPIGTTTGKSYTIHNHHIFPQSKLYENGYDPENLMHRAIVNEIANRAFLTANTNLELSNKLPEVYFPLVEDKFPGSLAKQFVPMDKYLWKIENYRDFLEARRSLISLKINEFLESLVAEPEIVHERPIEEIIQLGESATLEFKSTLQWDVVQNKQNPHLRKECLKTITAFLNSSGGTLVIGVEDDGNTYGIENDLSIVNRSNDRFATQLSNLISDLIGPEFAPFVKIRFENINSKQVCVVDIFQSPSPAFYQGERGKEFYNRLGPTSRLLDAEETVDYINMKWD